MPIIKHLKKWAHLLVQEHKYENTQAHTNTQYVLNLNYFFFFFSIDSLS